MNDIRIAKFQNLIQSINEMIKSSICDDVLKPSEYAYFYNRSPATIDLDKSKINMSLTLIFDYKKINEYAKMIMEYSKITWPIFDLYELIDRWDHEQVKFSNTENIILASLHFVNYCKSDYHSGKNEMYKFIFWALLILTVDKTDAEENLSLICDFAKMLHISELELEDIVNVIKNIYDTSADYVIKTETIHSIFNNVINLNKQN